MSLIKRGKCGVFRVLKKSEKVFIYANEGKVVCFVYFHVLSSSISITMADKQVPFSYLLNNTAMHSLNSYKIKLYDQTNKLVERLRWKGHFFELDNNCNYRPNSTNNY